MIKRIILAVIIVFTIQNNYAQHYRKFDSTTIWGAEFVYKVDGTCYVRENRKYSVQGYVVNNGNKWLQVVRQSTSNWHPSSPIATCMNLSFSMPGPYSATGYLLNDTINKRVYYRNSLPANYTPTASDLLYDFNNKIVGDTLSCYGSTQYRFKIYKIDSILFSGKYHKRFVTSVVPTPIGTTRVSFTEGIGCSIDPFYPAINGMNEQYGNLLCFSSPLQSLTVANDTTFTNGTCNNILLNIKQSGISEFTIYPNPSDGAITVIQGEYSPGTIEYAIQNVMGQTVLTGNLTNGSDMINIKGLNNGVYFINLICNNRPFSSKIIVAR